MEVNIGKARGWRTRREGVMDRWVMEMGNTCWCKDVNLAYASFLLYRVGDSEVYFKSLV